MPQKHPQYDKNGSQQSNTIATEAGILEMKTNIKVDEHGSLIPDDRSYVLLQDKFKSLIQFIGGTITIKAASDMCIIAGQNLFFSVKGDVQWNYGGDMHEYIQGNHTVQNGKQSKKHTEAAKQLQQTTKEIDKTKLDTIKETEGTPVPCPTCKQKFLTARAQQLSDKIFKYAEIYIPNFPFPLRKIQKYVNMLIVPFLSTSSNASLNGGQGCGSPGCINGNVKSPMKSIQAGNEKAAQKLNEKKDELAKHQKALESGGSKVNSDMGDVVWRVGTAKNDSPTVVLKDHTTVPFGFVNAANASDGLRLSTKGNCKQAIHSDPLINPGSLMIDVSNKLTITAGSPGIDIHTSGKTQINSSVTSIYANEGELTLGSNNKTTLKGKNIMIDAKDRSGDSGVRIDADNTMVGGQLNVAGDLALKGSLIMDGSIYCSHLHCPSERLDTTTCGSSNQVHSNPSWNHPLTQQATILDTFDKTIKAIGQELYNTLSLQWLDIREIIRKTKDTYSSAMIKVPVDNMGVPTGYGWAYSFSTFTPLKVLVGGPTGVMEGIVIPDIIPLHNYPHNHGNPGDNHSHEHTVPAFDGHDNAAASKGTRPNPSHVPTPAKAKGMGVPPGPKSLGDLSSCGGGGAAFVSSRVANYKNKRNKNYNITGDPYNGENYVNLTPETGNYKFNEDGSMNPPPTFNPVDCD
jgi:hypothetical protein